MKVGEPVDYLDEPTEKGPIYNHPMDKILREIQSRQIRARIDIKLSHVFLYLAFILLGHMVL